MRALINDNPAKVDSLTKLGRLQAEWAAHTKDDESQARVEHFKRAVESFERAIQLCREMGDHDREAKLLMELGEIELKRGAWKRALETFRRALDIYRQIDDPAGKARAFEGLAEAHIRFGDFELSEMYFHDAMRYFQLVNDPSSIARVQTRRAVLALRIQAIPKALKAIASAAQYYESHHNEEGIFLTRHLRDLAEEISRGKPNFTKLKGTPS